MKNLEQLPTELFDLLADKPYADLSATEKEWVNALLSSAEYDEFHNLIKDFSATDEAVEVKSDPAAFEYKTKTPLRSILNYQLPFYQVAASFLVFAVLTFSLNNYMETPIQYLPIDDTVLPYHVGDSTQQGRSLADDDYPEELVFDF